MRTEEMTTEMLRKRLSDVLTEIGVIKDQLERAKSNTAATGDYSDRDWFNRANSALRAKGRECQLVQMTLGKREREARRERNDSLDRLFILVAKRRLDADLFREIMEEARQEQEIRDLDHPSRSGNIPDGLYEKEGNHV